MKHKVFIGLLNLVLVLLLSSCQQVLGSKSGSIIGGETQEPGDGSLLPGSTPVQVLAQTGETSSGESTQQAVATAEPVNAPPAEATPVPTEQSATEPTSATPATSSDQAAATESAVATPAGLPATHNLRKGEFPWCIARRYDVNPHELMQLNGFRNGQTFFPGQVLDIPQTGNPFPGKRALHKHPDMYRVKPGDTLWSIACYYGDVDPRAIAELNGIEKPKKLKPGRVLQIPAESADMTGVVPM